MCSLCNDSAFYRAPSNIEETCVHCAAPIRPDELIGEPHEGEFIHEACWERQFTDEEEQALERAAWLVGGLE